MTVQNATELTKETQAQVVEVEVVVVRKENPPCSVMEGFGSTNYTEEEILQAGYAKAKKIFSFF